MINSAYSEEFYHISFSDQVGKQAYLKACKWLAKNVYSKDELSKYVTVKILKDTERKLPTFTVYLYITIKERERKLDYCNKCKSLYTIMYAVDTPDCNTCKLQGYQKSLHSGVENLVKFWREMFENEEQL